MEELSGMLLLRALEERQNRWIQAESEKYTPKIPGLSTTRHVIEKSKFSVATHCSICMEESKISDTSGKLICSHIFHWKCLDRWLRTSAICPICRKTVFKNNT
jgi:hypothetical protein